MKEIETKSEFRRWLADGARPTAAVQGLALETDTHLILGLDFADSLFIGCGLEAEATLHIVSTGGLVFPKLDGFQFATHRPRLYSAAELFEGFDPGDPDGFFNTRDFGIYKEFCEHGRNFPKSIRVTLARRLHDHSITDALMEIIDGRKVVAVMGGHGLERADSEFARVARIARSLTRLGYLMVSGGGPGAMEATHLGAHMAAREDQELDEALRILAPRPGGAEPGKEYSDPDWLHRAWEVLRRFPIPAGAEAPSMSVGIPTWLYGHEPPTPFASHIAKYFANSVREDGVLMIANHGVIFVRGSAGTTQEIFQNAAQNHYETAGRCSPMVLLGIDFWTRQRPVWPLLQSMSRSERWGEHLFISDSETEVVRHITAFPTH